MERNGVVGGSTAQTVANRLHHTLRAELLM